MERKIDIEEAVDESRGCYRELNGQEKLLYMAGAKFGAQWQAEQSGWISVKAHKNIPIGNWLFALEKAIGGEVIHTGNKNEKFIIIAGKFSWDVPNIIAYMPLPNPPQP